MERKNLTYLLQLIIFLIISKDCLGGVVSQNALLHNFFQSFGSITILKENLNSHLPGKKNLKYTKDLGLLNNLGDDKQLKTEIAQIEIFLDEEFFQKGNNEVYLSEKKNGVNKVDDGFLKEEESVIKNLINRIKSNRNTFKNDQLIMIDLSKKSPSPAQNSKTFFLNKNFNLPSNNNLSTVVQRAIKREMSGRKSVDTVNLKLAKNRMNSRRGQNGFLKTEIIKNYEEGMRNSIVSLQVFDAKINVGVKDKIFNFEWRPHYNKSIRLGDSGSGFIELKSALNKNDNYSMGTVFHYGSLVSRIGILFNEGYQESKIPLLNIRSLEKYLDGENLKGEGGFVLLHFKKGLYRVNLDSPFEKKIYLNSNFKIQKYFGGHKYVLFIGVKPGNTLLSLINEKGDKSEKIIFVENAEITFENPDVREPKLKKVSLVKKNLLGNRNSDFRIENKKASLFNRPNSYLKKVGLNLYEFKRPYHEKGARFYFRFDHLKKSIYLGINDSKKAILPSEEFMQKIINSFDLEDLDKRCLIQLNLDNSPIKFQAGGESAIGPMSVETLYLDKEGGIENNLENISELTNFIFLLGDLEGVINLKIDYVNGSSDLIQTICSSDDYLIEQL